MPGTTSSSVASGLSAFVEVRSRLFGIAYRILGSAASAEDVVQEAWLRWQAIDPGVVQNAPAYLATTTTRLAINVVQSARSHRETYVGTWLPEPVDVRPDPESEAERGEALRQALLLLGALSPKERAAYVLREAFSYSYRQIGDLLQLDEANVRQLTARARRRIAERRRPAADPGRRPPLLDAFIAATRKGDRSALEELFVSDIASGRRTREPRAGKEWPACQASQLASAPASAPPRTSQVELTR